MLPPGNWLLPPNKRAVFAEKFEKDLSFFRLIFLLINRSSPIKNIDLIWRESEGTGAKEVRQYASGVVQALEESFSGYLTFERKDPTPRFCRIISDEGRRYAESCGRCDSAAMDRVGQSGRAEIYRCHAGLTDIAVPVISEGKHIATLFAGQVHTEPPSKAGFARIRRQIRHLAYIDQRELKDAYWRVPVVSQQDLERTVRILEIFADYIATSWSRLNQALESFQRRMHAAQLHRKELAHLLLEDDGAERQRITELARELGLSHYPNRVLIVQPEEEMVLAPADKTGDLDFARILQAVEETCKPPENALSAYLRGRGLCVLFWDRSDGAGGPSDFQARRLAQRILSRLAERTGAPVRIGIGRIKKDWRQLRESYHEAKVALAESNSQIAVCGLSAHAVRDLSEKTEEACRLLAERRLKEALALLLSLPILARRSLRQPADAVAATRRFLVSLVEPLGQTALKLGCERTAVLEWNSECLEAVELSPTHFHLYESWAAACQRLVDSVDRLYAGKHEKLVGRVQQIVRRELERGRDSSRLGLASLAASLGVSAGHLSRTFKRVTGETLERYLMRARVERAQQLLLDPASRVSEVAEQCGFCNPAYFARVFRRFKGCSPRQFSKHPAQAVTA
jgi:AraC-like DNA-binding protein